MHNFSTAGKPGIRVRELATDFKQKRSLEELCRVSRKIRDTSKGCVISFSPKVFIPLTQLCRDFCKYCMFRQSPRDTQKLYMTPEEVLEVALAGQAAACREALFVLGERPEERYSEARNWLRRHGYESTLEYLCAMCELVLRETDLYPHSNPGTMAPAELRALKEVNVSMGLMLESVSPRLCLPGGPHEHAPSKHPNARLRMLEVAGQLSIPFTTGLLIGIGETSDERVDTLLEIKNLHRRFGHIQEVIIQNFRSKPGTPMETASEASHQAVLETIALARIILGGEMNIQAPPNLASDFGQGSKPAACGPHSASYLSYLDAGINDWGGISPVTQDYVNPEAPWPQVVVLRREMKLLGYQLRARFPVYPEYIQKTPNFIPPQLLVRLQSEADLIGYFSEYEERDNLTHPPDPPVSTNTRGTKR